MLGFVLLTVAPAGAPVQVSYVFSDSMSPTIETNDAFLVVDSDGVETGDVITFWDAQRETYVTHRVVGTSEAGFITKGDNNPTTDQAAGRAPVRQSDVVGEVVTYGGAPLTVPGYGAAVIAIQEHRLLTLLVAGGAMLLTSLRPGDRDARPSRSVQRVRHVVRPLFAASAASVVAVVLLTAISQQFVFVAVATPSAAPNTLTVGEPQETTLTVERSASPFTRSVVGAHGMTVTNQSRNASAVSVTARIPPPESTGRHATRLTVHQYPAVAPTWLLRTLHGVHPAVPAVLTTLLVLAPLYLAVELLIDVRATDRSAPIEG
ncbi:MAG: signal peptidase I [Halobacteriaceae archaeon]